VNISAYHLNFDKQGMPGSPAPTPRRINKKLTSDCSRAPKYVIDKRPHIRTKSRKKNGYFVYSIIRFIINKIPDFFIRSLVMKGDNLTRK
jgi:hypothetical protein